MSHGLFYWCPCYVCGPLSCKEPCQGCKLVKNGSFKVNRVDLYKNRSPSSYLRFICVKSPVVSYVGKGIDPPYSFCWWMRILASQYITTAKTRKVVQCEFRMLEYVIYNVITRDDSTRSRVRPEQHTLISVFKLNSCNICRLNILEPEDASSCAQWEDAWAYQKRANPLLRTRANIKLSLKYCVWMDKFTQTFSKCLSW